MTEDTFRIVVTTGVGIAVLSMLVLAIVAVAMLKTVGKVRERVDTLSGKAEPILKTLGALTEENSSRISEIVRNAREVSNDARDISGVAKDQAHRFAEVGKDIADRTRAQVSRLDSAVDDTIDRAHEAGETVKAAVLKPVREVSGIAAGVRAAVSTFAHGGRPSIDHVTQDEEMFI